MKTSARNASCLRDSANGTVTIIFAAAAVPIVLLTGLAFSFGLLTVAKEQLDLASDTAALAAASTAARSFTAGQTDYISEGTAAGEQWFQNQSAVILGSLSKPTDTVKVTQSGGSFSATVSYTASVASVLGNWFGSSGVVTTQGTAQQQVYGSGLTNTSSVTITTNAFVDVDFLLDNSSSMMIGATETDIQRLGALLYQIQGVTMPASAAGLQNYHCAFACHWTQTGGGTDYYAVARAASPAITLRWDVLQSAMQTAITQMQTLEVIPNQFDIGVYSFGDPSFAPLKTIYPDNTDISAAKTVVAANTSPVVIDAANTDFPAAMTAFANLATPAGDGSTQLVPKKALIIVTDGIADYGSRSIPTSEGPMDPADCDAIKAKGYQVFVLYTTYSTDYPLVLLNNQNLATYINGTGPGSLVGNLQACASGSQNFIQASSPADIQAGLTQLLSVAVGSAAKYTQ